MIIEAGYYWVKFRHYDKRQVLGWEIVEIFGDNAWIIGSKDEHEISRIEVLGPKIIPPDDGKDIIPREVACDNCNGKGRQPLKNAIGSKMCLKCMGRGKVII